MDDYGRIRRGHRDGMSIREMARRFHHSRHKIREILRGDRAEPGAYSPRRQQAAPKLTAATVLGTIPIVARRTRIDAVKLPAKCCVLNF